MWGVVVRYYLLTQGPLPQYLPSVGRNSAACTICESEPAPGDRGGPLAQTARLPRAHTPLFVRTHRKRLLPVCPEMSSASSIWRQRRCLRSPSHQGWSQRTGMRSQDLTNAEEAGILLNYCGDLPAACAVQCCGRPLGTN